MKPLTQLEDIPSSVIPPMAPGDRVPSEKECKKRKKRVEEWKEEDMKSLVALNLLESTQSSAGPLVETRSAKKLQKPHRIEECKSGVLLEWFESSSDPKERLRQAIGGVVQAIMDVAYEDIKDSGKSFKPYKDGEHGYWTATENAIRKEMNVDMAMEIVEKAQKVLKSYQE
jgi:hypothetical protein